MKKSIKNNFLKNISFLKIAGVDKFIMLDVYDNYLKILYVNLKEPLYKFINTSNITDYQIIAFEKMLYNGVLDNIETLLKQFVEKYNAFNARSIIGINEYRTKTLVINKEVEDVNMWFLENTDKFIPPGRPVEEFSYAYEKYKEDDDNYYFLIAICRKDYISKLTKLCGSAGIKLLSITPFLLSFHSIDKVKNIKAILVDFSDSTLGYSFTDVNENLFTGKIYHQIFTKDPTGDVSTTSIDRNNLIETIKQLSENIKLASNGNGTDQMNLYIAAPLDWRDEIEDGLKKVLSPVCCNPGYEKIQPDLLTFVFVLENMLNKFDNKINLLNNEVLDKERFEIEKQIVFRATIVSGVLLVSLLFFVFAIENFVSSKIKSGQDNLLEVKAKTSVVQKLEDENIKLKSNLKRLEQLKGSRTDYSRLLTSLSKVVTKKSCFTDIILKEAKDNVMSVTLNGIAFNQQEVAEVMSNMEESKSFGKISLLYSGIIKTKDLKTDILMGQKEIIQFNLGCEYNAY